VDGTTTLSERSRQPSRQVISFFRRKYGLMASSGHFDG